MFSIKVETYSNEDTGLEAYNLYIEEIDENYDQSRIIWYVASGENTKAVAKRLGSSYEFIPEISTNYIITVKLLSKDGKTETTIANPIALTPKAVQGTSIFLILGIAVGVLAVLCVATILISNKVREKIW
jgi:subtilase family serine protease